MRRFPRGRMIALAIASRAAVLAGGAAEPQGVFRVTVPAVSVDAQVRQGSRTIQGLVRDDFIVLEDGQPRAIAYFGYGSRPLDLLLLLDTNCWLQAVAAKIAEGMQFALAALHPGDRVAVMAFGARTRIVADLAAEVRHSADAISGGKQPVAFGGGGFTNINGAIADAADYLRARPRKDVRRAILMFTFNRGIRHTRNRTVLRKLWEADAVLDAVILASWKHDQIFTLPFEANVKHLVAETGGEYVMRATDAGTLQALLERIRGCYELQYRAPAGPGGRLRRVRVELAPAAKRKYPHSTVQARRGYVVMQTVE